MCSPKDIKVIFDEVKKDNLSGSGSLLQKLTEKLTACTSLKRTYSPDEAKNIQNLFNSFSEEMADFAVISHFCNHVSAQISKGSLKSTQGLHEVIKRYSEKWADINTRVANNFISTVDIKNKTVLLHSQSSAVITLFDRLKEKTSGINIIQTESRPMYEGRQQAEKLAGMGFPVKLVTDTGFSPLITNIDIAILGADRIYNDAFINKAGSYAIALLCREHNIPLYILADSRKFIDRPSSGSHPEKEKPREEVWSAPPPGVTPVNLYLEPIPRSLVTKFITEKYQL